MGKFIATIIKINNVFKEKLNYKKGDLSNDKNKAFGGINSADYSV